MADLADMLPKKGLPPGTVCSGIARELGRKNMLSWTSAACGTGDDGGATGDMERRTVEDTGGNCQKASLCHEIEVDNVKCWSMRAERSVIVLGNLVAFRFSSSCKFSRRLVWDTERDMEVRAVTNEAEGIRLEMRVAEDSLRWIIRPMPSALKEIIGMRRKAGRY